mmetsp:Transcript_93844/g.280106  ORF Transcript_93844/g.280106 Transcript_93844/m.280106 type:complete len:202 (+) Transcript_93844:925-1530(+)
MKPGSSAVSRGGFVEKRLFRLRICRMGSMSEIFTDMSLFRKVRRRRSMSSRVSLFASGTCPSTASGICSSVASEAQPAAVPSLLLRRPRVSPPHSPLQLPSGSLLSPADCARWRVSMPTSSSDADEDPRSGNRAPRSPFGSSEVAMGLSCARAARAEAPSCLARAPLAHLARRRRTSASETTGSSSLSSRASTKETWSCSH